MRPDKVPAINGSTHQAPTDNRMGVLALMDSPGGIPPCSWDFSRARHFPGVILNFLENILQKWD
jgi:hypothetical protein